MTSMMTLDEIINTFKSKATKQPFDMVVIRSGDFATVKAVKTTPAHVDGWGGQFVDTAEIVQGMLIVTI